MGQLSQLVEQHFELVTDYERKVKNSCNLAGLFEALDQIVLGDKKDSAPFVDALKILFGAFTTRQPDKQSLTDYHRDFESRLGLLEPSPKLEDTDKELRNLLSPVLLCAPHFSQEFLKKDYALCTPVEKEKVHLDAANKIKDCLFLMLSKMLKDKHNQYLGGQDTYPPNMGQAICQVTDYKPTNTGAAPASTFAITGSPMETTSICHLCGKVPDCPNPTCKAHYASNIKIQEAIEFLSPSRKPMSPVLLSN